MTQRSITVGQNPHLIIRAGGNVEVQGSATDRVVAETDSKWGLKIGRSSEKELARARAKVGDHVLFDIRLNKPNRPQKDSDEDAIEIEIGGSGTVQVPMGSSVEVYAGRSVQVDNIQGRIAVDAGRDVQLRAIHMLAHASAGRGLDFECEAIEGSDIKFSAGRDIRCYIRSLTNAKYLIDDLGGYWEAIVGDGSTQVRLKSGGDVTLVTDQEIVGDVLGKIERPGAAPAKAKSTE